MTPYQQYLAAEHWKLLRSRKLKLSVEFCSICGCTERIQVHHILYRHPFTLCTPDVLQVMCEWSHASFHRKGLPTQRKPEQFRSKSGANVKTKIAFNRAKKLALIAATPKILKRFSSLTGPARKRYARKMCSRFAIP